MRYLNKWHLGNYIGTMIADFDLTHLPHGSLLYYYPSWSNKFFSLVLLMMVVKSTIVESVLWCWWLVTLVVCCNFSSKIGFSNSFLYRFFLSVQFQFHVVISFDVTDSWFRRIVQETNWQCFVLYVPSQTSVSWVSTLIRLHHKTVY